MDREAKRILDLPNERLTLRERFDVSLIREALLAGCSFETKQDAQRYIRSQRIEIVLYMIALVSMFGLGMLSVVF